jgi:hypothetical protein
VPDQKRVETEFDGDDAASGGVGDRSRPPTGSVNVTHDLRSAMTDRPITETWYECQRCGHRGAPGDRTHVCPVCDARMKNVAVQQE